MGRGETQLGREQRFGNRKARKYMRSNEYATSLVGEARRAEVKSRQGVWWRGSISYPFQVRKHHKYIA